MEKSVPLSQLTDSLDSILQNSLCADNSKCFQHYIDDVEDDESVNLQKQIAGTLGDIHLSAKQLTKLQLDKLILVGYIDRCLTAKSKLQESATAAPFITKQLTNLHKATCEQLQVECSVEPVKCWIESFTTSKGISQKEASNTLIMYFTYFLVCADKDFLTNYGMHLSEDSFVSEAFKRPRSLTGVFSPLPEAWPFSTDIGICRTNFTKKRRHDASNSSCEFETGDSELSERKIQSAESDVGICRTNFTKKRRHDASNSSCGFETGDSESNENKMQSAEEKSISSKTPDSCYSAIKVERKTPRTVTNAGVINEETTLDMTTNAVIPVVKPDDEVYITSTFKSGALSKRYSIQCISSQNALKKGSWLPIIDDATTTTEYYYKHFNNTPLASSGTGSHQEWCFADECALYHAVKLAGIVDVDWNKVVCYFGNSRSATALRNKWKKVRGNRGHLHQMRKCCMQQAQSTQIRWNPQEEDLLYQAVRDLGPYWDEVSKSLGFTTTPTQCLYHWMSMCKVTTAMNDLKDKHGEIILPPRTSVDVIPEYYIDVAGTM